MPAANWKRKIYLKGRLLETLQPLVLLNFDWEMPQPLVLPAPHGDSLDLALTPEESSVDASKHKEHETQSTASLKSAPVEASTQAKHRS